MGIYQRNGKSLDPNAVLNAFISVEDADLTTAARTYVDANLRPVPLGLDKRPWQKEFGLRMSRLEDFNDKRTSNVGVLTGDMGNGLCCFDHDSKEYRETFLSLCPPTLGIGRSGELRKSFILIKDGSIETRKCAVPKNVTSDKGEFGSFKAGKNTSQHQVVVPPGQWHGQNGEEQSLEVISREEPVVMTSEQAAELVTELHNRVMSLHGISPRPPVIGAQEALDDALGLDHGNVAYAKIKAMEALQRLCVKLRAATQENSGRGDLLWNYSCIIATYVRCGLLEDEHAKNALRQAAETWGGDHTTARIEHQIARGWLVGPSKSAVDDVRRWTHGQSMVPHLSPSPAPQEAGARVLSNRSEGAIAKAIIDDLGECAALGDKLYTYDNSTRIWSEMGSSALISKTLSLDGASYFDIHGDTKRLQMQYRLAESVCKFVRHHPNVYQPTFLTSSPMGIALDSMFLGQDLVLRPLVKSHNALYKMPFDYDPYAACPAFVSFLDDVFLGDSDALRKKMYLQEFVGMCLLGLATMAQKATVLFGSGGNGKGRLIQILKAIFPPNSYSCISPDFMINQNHRVNLIGKRLNVCDDMPTNRIQRTEILKQVIAGDEIECEPKYCQPYNFKPIAGHIYSINELPETDDITPGFFRRFVVVEFNRPMYDLENKDEIRSAENRQKLKEWFWSDLMKTESRYGSETIFIYIDTIKHEDSLLVDLIESPQWASVQLSICDENYKSYDTNYMTDAEIMEEVEEHRRLGTLDAFYMERMNIPISSEDAVFKQSYFKYFEDLGDRIRVGEEEFRTYNMLHMTIVDPAKTVKMQSADSAVITVAVDRNSGKVFVRDIVSEKFYPDQLYDEMFRQVQHFNSFLMGYEITGLNEFIIQPIQNECRVRNMHPLLVELNARKGVGESGKAARIATMAPSYRMGYIYHNKNNCGKLEMQLLGFPKSKLWDVMDCLAYHIFIMDKHGVYFDPSNSVEEEPPEDEFDTLDCEKEMNLEEMGFLV